MKQIKYILITLLAVTSLMGCKKFLDTTPTDTFSPEQAYGNEANMTKALAGIYDLLGNFTSGGGYNNFNITTDACTDDSFYPRSTVTSGVNVYNFDFTDANINTTWNDLYRGISRANSLIAHINDPKMDEGKRAVILGEAKFMRGFYYFLLVTQFGDVPLRLESVISPDNLDIARTPVKEVYAQILKDMTEAEAVLPNSSSYGYSSRVSKTVAEGILAKVCLHMAGKPLSDKTKYADAAAWAKKVKESGEHFLRTTYDKSLTNNSAFAQVFINMSQDIYDVKESMWEVDFKGNRADGYFETGRMGSNVGITMTNIAFQADSGYCYGFLKGTGRLYKLYADGDLRRDWTLTTYTYGTVTTNGVVSPFQRLPIANTAANMYNRDAAKWRRPFELLKPKSKNDSPTNFPLLRYSDVLLMLAEADNQANNGPTQAAYDALNQVRRRAYGATDLTAVNLIADAPLGMSRDAFQLFIEDERSRELAFEALRKLDLVRWGKLVTNLQLTGADMAANGGGVSYAKLGMQNVATKHLLFPIPSGEIALNKKIAQNPGW
jgi:hypothetical protein